MNSLYTTSARTPIAISAFDQTQASGKQAQADNSSQPNKQQGDQAQISQEAQDAFKKDAEGKAASLAGNKELSQVEQTTVQNLKIRDREVRQHEQAHKSAAGGYANGAISFQYQQGPDNKRYAVGGEVSISSGKESDPQQTIRKMDTVRRAALAPANPSSQDRSVAAGALQTKNQAIIEYRQAMVSEEATNDEQNTESDADSESSAISETDANPATSDDKQESYQPVDMRA